MADLTKYADKSKYHVVSAYDFHVTIKEAMLGNNEVETVEDMFAWLMSFVFQCMETFVSPNISNDGMKIVVMADKLTDYMGEVVLPKFGTTKLGRSIDLHSLWDQIAESSWKQVKENFVEDNHLAKAEVGDDYVVIDLVASELILEQQRAMLTMPGPGPGELH